MKSQTVNLILSKLPYTNVGGVETAIRHLVIEIEDQGKTFKFLPAGEKNSIKIKGQALSFINIILLPFYLIRSKSVILHLPNPIQSLFVLFWKCIFPYRKLVVFYHSEIIGFGIVGSFFNKIERLLIDKSDRIIFSSKRYEQSILKSNKSNKSLIYEFDVDIQRVQEQHVREIPEKYMLYFGRLAPYKNLEILNTIVQLNDEVNLIVCGPKDPRFDIELDKHIQIISRYITEGEKKYLLSKASLLLFPSTSRAETFGIVQKEALVCGTPVINFKTSTGVPTVNKFGRFGICIDLDQENPNLEFARQAINFYMDDKKIISEKSKCKKHHSQLEKKYKKLVFDLIDDGLIH